MSQQTSKHRTNQMKIAIASEHRGFHAKSWIVSRLTDLDHEAFDFGPSSGEMCDYPDFAAKAALAVSKGSVHRAILIGGTGIGMSIVANKFPGVRATLCHDELSAELSRRHYDANVLCLSADVLREELVARMIESWLSTPFDGAHHERRIAKIVQHEREIQERRTTEVNDKVVHRLTPE